MVTKLSPNALLMTLDGMFAGTMGGAAFFHAQDLDVFNNFLPVGCHRAVINEILRKPDSLFYQ